MPAKPPAVLLHLQGQLPRCLGGSASWSLCCHHLHRLTGIGLALFLFMHVFTITMAVAADPSSYDLMMRKVQQPLFKLAELLLYAGLLFHGWNGLRLLCLELLPLPSRYQAQLSGLVLLLCLLGFLWGAWALQYNAPAQALLSESLPGAAP